MKISVLVVVSLLMYVTMFHIGDQRSPTVSPVTSGNQRIALTYFGELARKRQALQGLRHGAVVIRAGRQKPHMALEKAAISQRLFRSAS